MRTTPWPSLWMLKPDDTAPLIETFTEPRYLRDLASEMLVKTDGHVPYPSRGAVARAVKTFLGERGIAVSTLVRQGSMVTGIDLRPPSEAWTSDEVTRMRIAMASAAAAGPEVNAPQSPCWPPFERVASPHSEGKRLTGIGRVAPQGPPEGQRDRYRLAVAAEGLRRPRERPSPRANSAT